MATKRSDGSVSTFCIHHLLHDFSVSILGQSNFYTISGDDDTTLSSNRVRRLALHRITNEFETTNRSLEKLRSFLCFSKSSIHLSELLNKCGKLLRVLDVEDVKILERRSLEEIGKFPQLSYLNMRNTHIKSPPFIHWQPCKPEEPRYTSNSNQNVTHCHSEVGATALSIHGYG